MIVVVGESLIDVVVDPDGDVHEAVGGSALNVAVGLGRLDTPTVLITQLGNDDRGGRIIEHATTSGVELVVAPASHTATAAARLDEHGGAVYEFDLVWNLPTQELPACDALHVGALGALLEPGRTTVLDLVDQAYARGVPVSYDPNVREALIEDRDLVWRDVEALADRSSVVKLSDQDVEVLHPGADPADIARSLLRGERTDLVLLTRGANGSTAYVEGLEVTVPAPPTEVVDTVGAGDSFVAATLTVLLETSALGSYGAGLPRSEQELRRLLAAAGTAASLTCERRGAQPPTRPELPADWP
ncbi:carbohydrate kinase family protein [Nocardioides terrisoli]|uniref:carbohydrate kinase family protein n=1 Tax=Nocardioides terrisoli TaxID=3388267 RepID=UPI00287BC099|nr:carbohydrate kinase [Nocardioides marmorisolisilvae]